MTTAIIGVGKIGSAIARHLTAGGEQVVLAARNESDAAALAGPLGSLASAAPVGRQSLSEKALGPGGPPKRPPRSSTSRVGLGTFLRQSSGLLWTSKRSTCSSPPWPKRLGPPVNRAGKM